MKGIWTGIALVATALLLAASCGGSDAEEPEAAPHEATLPASAGGGTAPSFRPTQGDYVEGGKYVSADEVKRELDRGADFVILDVRPPEQFAESHVTGAVSIPFYEVEGRLEELPTDTWIVAYCSCPRAEAEAAVKVLVENGYDQVAVLYEGYPEWVSRGYPSTSG